MERALFYYTLLIDTSLALHAMAPAVNNLDFYPRELGPHDGVIQQRVAPISVMPIIMLGADWRREESEKAGAWRTTGPMGQLHVFKHWMSGRVLMELRRSLCVGERK